MADVNAINRYLHERLFQEHLPEVTAVEAARCLQEAGLLKDSISRPGQPLRNLLRARLIDGQHQEPNKRWYIRSLRLE